ncbi:MAG: DUF4232 domain-containing protein [Acidimicrobiales bacterium]
MDPKARVSWPTWARRRVPGVVSSTVLALALGTVVSVSATTSSGGATIDRSCLIRVSHGPQVSPATQELVFSLKLTNTDSVACAIRGYPVVRFLGANGAPLPFVYRHRPNADVAFPAGPPRRFILKPFASGYVLVVKEECIGPDGRAAARMTVLAPSLQAGTLPWVVHLDASYPGISICTGADAAANNVVAVSPVEPSPKDLF